jgi:hypothetical protein
MSDWQPIADAPKDGTLVDLWVGDVRRPDCFWESEDDWGEPHWRQLYAEQTGCTFPVDGEPTHWMARPAAATGDEPR